MTKKTTKNELLAELDLEIESASPDLASSGETPPASVADVEERHRTLTGWREQIEAADDDDPIIEEIAAKLDS
ncbi:UNVERIFIED_CONTAM: hypothetical protein DES50_103304 [Williamsia faeni]